MSEQRTPYRDAVLAMPERERYALDVRPRTDKALEWRSVKDCGGAAVAPWPWDPSTVTHGGRRG